MCHKWYLRVLPLNRKFQSYSVFGARRKTSQSNFWTFHSSLIFLRYNWHKIILVSVLQHNDLIFVHNADDHHSKFTFHPSPHTVRKELLFLWWELLRFTLFSNLQIGSTIFINYSHYAVPRISRTYDYTKDCTFDPLHPFCLPPTPASSNYQSIFLYLWAWFLIFQIPHLIEIM